MPWCLAIQQQTMFSVLDTDASQNTIGTELNQIQDGIEGTIGYENKVLASTKMIYCTTRKELLALYALLDIFGIIFKMSIFNQERP